MGEAGSIPRRYRYCNSRGYCEIYKKKSRRFPLSIQLWLEPQGMADGPALWSKPMGRQIALPHFGTLEGPVYRWRGTAASRLAWCGRRSAWRARSDCGTLSTTLRNKDHKDQPLKPPRHSAVMTLMMTTGKGSSLGFKSLALNYLPAMRTIMTIRRQLQPAETCCGIAKHCRPVSSPPARFTPIVWNTRPDDITSQSLSTFCQHLKTRGHILKTF